MSDHTKPNLEAGCGGKGRPCPRPKRSALVKSVPLKSYIAKLRTDVPISSPPSVGQFGRYRLRGNEVVTSLFLRNRYDWATEAPTVSSVFVDIQLRPLLVPGTESLPIITIASDVDLVALEGRLFYVSHADRQFIKHSGYGFFLQNNGPTAVVPENSVEIEALIQTSLLKVRSTVYDENDTPMMMTLGGDSSESKKKKSSEDKEETKIKPLRMGLVSPKKHDHEDEDDTAELEKRVDTERRRHERVVREAVTESKKKKSEAKSDSKKKKSHTKHHHNNKNKKSIPTPVMLFTKTPHTKNKPSKAYKNLKVVKEFNKRKQNRYMVTASPLVLKDSIHHTHEGLASECATCGGR